MQETLNMFKRYISNSNVFTFVCFYTTCVMNVMKFSKKEAISIQKAQQLFRKTEIKNQLINMQISQFPTNSGNYYKVENCKNTAKGLYEDF